MSAGLLFPKTRIVDDSGTPLPGAKLYTYDAGTTTEQTTYQDDDLSVAHANPVVADANGWIGPVYGEGQDFKLSLKTSADVVVWTLDNVKPLWLYGSSSADRISQLGTCPLDYGAVGDGIADESTAVQAAIDAATATVDLMGKTFRCDSAVTLRSGLTLKNGTLDFSQCADNSYILATGTLGSAVSLATDGAMRGTSFDVADATGLAADDWLYLDDTDSVATLVQIHSVSGVTLTLTRPLEQAYGTAAGASIRKITTVDEVAFQDLTVLCTKASAGTGDAIDLTHCRSARIERVRVERPKTSAVRLSGCIGSVVDQLDVEEGGAASIGIAIETASYGTVIDRSRVARCATGISVGADTTSQVSRTIIRDALVERCTVGIRCSNYQLGTRLLAPRVQGGTQAIYVTGPDVEVSDCDIFGSTYGVYADIDGDTRSGSDVTAHLTVRGGTIENVGGGTEYGIYADIVQTMRVRISDVVIRAPYSGITIASVANTTNVSITGCTIEMTASSALDGRDCVLISGKAANIAITGNQIFGIESAIGVHLDENAAGGIVAGVVAANNFKNLNTGIFIDSSVATIYHSANTFADVTTNTFGTFGTVIAS